MRALVVTEKGKLNLSDIPQPSINAYQALVRIECCGICNSTDWKIIRGQMPWAGPFPLVLGHESVGKVVQIGAKVRKFKVGDRVTRPVYPRSDKLNSAFGGFGEFGIVTDAQAMADDGDASLLEDYTAQRQNVAPSDLEPDQAALAISLAETASGLIDLPNLRNKTVVVAGTGIAGLAFVLWCKLAGARVIALGRRAARLTKARELGADQTISTDQPDWVKQLLAAAGGAVDGVIEAVGDIKLAEQLLAVLKVDGFASAYGAPPDSQSYGPRWIGMNVREHLSYDWVADLIRRKWIDPQWFISHQWKLDDVIAAFDEVHKGQVLKGFVQLV